jgi:succinate semialdehyde reductase
VEKLNFRKIFLKQDLAEASELILTDRKHLDNNPRQISKNDIVFLLKKINNDNFLRKIGY